MKKNRRGTAAHGPYVKPSSTLIHILVAGINLPSNTGETSGKRQGPCSRGDVGLSAGLHSFSTKQWLTSTFCADFEPEYKICGHFFVFPTGHTQKIPPPLSPPPQN